MKLVVQVKLLPDETAQAALRETLHACNRAADHASRRAFANRKNRPDQSTFHCTSCGFAEHADVNAGRNIAERGAAVWAVSHAADDAA